MKTRPDVLLGLVYYLETNSNPLLGIKVMTESKQLVESS